MARPATSKTMIPPDWHGYFDMLSHGTRSKEKKKRKDQSSTDQEDKIILEKIGTYLKKKVPT